MRIVCRTKNGLIMRDLLTGNGCRFRRRTRHLLQLLLLLLATTWPAAIAVAQFGPGLILPPGTRNSAPGDFDPYQRLPRDPLTQSSVLKAVKALEAGEITSGLETIQEVREHDSDFFISEPGQPPRSLFGDLEELISEHREEYQRLYGPEAARMLAEARSGQNRSELEEIVRRYGLTDAGADALEELIRIHRDCGEPGLAARQLEQLALHPRTKTPGPLLRSAVMLLMASGEKQMARELIERRQDRLPNPAEFSVLLTTVPARSVSALSDVRGDGWRTPFGTEHQVPQAAPAPALFDDSWQSPLINDDYDFPALMAAPEVAHQLGVENRNLLSAIEQQVRSHSERIAFPAPIPLIVRNQVIVSGPGSLKAHDLQTGKLLWNGVDLDETFDYLAKQSYSAGERLDPVREEMRELFAAVRGWRDLTSCSLSSDGERIYAVSNCQLVGTASRERMVQNTQRHSLLPQRFNRLAAYELKSDGKKIWSNGTPGEEEPFFAGEEPREIYFLGAPLPVDGRLYVLAEERGQVQLLELDSATGAILWGLGLSNPYQDLVLADDRRLAGLMPSYGNGLLYCPTGEGTLTAIDPIQRRVVWTHLYGGNSPALRNQLLMLRMGRQRNQNAAQAREKLLEDQRWFDSRVMMAGDFVIYTPPDEDLLICLDSATGKPAWKMPREQMVYAATIFENKVILVGRSEMTARDLTTGKPAWRSSIPIAHPSGRGVRMGDQFLQPLVSGEIAVINLRSGHLLTRIPLESGEIPGNLVADHGQLIMQTATGLRAFRARSLVESTIARKLEQNPNDAEALSVRGLWNLQQGKLEQGLDDLKKAVAHQAPPSVRRVLAWALLEGLRTDFARYREQAPLVESGLTDPSQRLQFLRIFAMGLQTAGDYEQAFEHYLEILRIAPIPETRISMDDQWSVTDTSWVLARMEELFSITDEATRKRLKTFLTDWVRKSTDIALLMRVLPVIPSDWLDSQVVLERLFASEEMETALNEREAILRTLVKNSMPAVRGRAAAQLLTLAIRSKDVVTAREMLAILESQAVILEDGNPETTQDWARKKRQEADVADLLHSGFYWPDDVRETDHAPAAIREVLFQIPLLGPPSEALAGWTFFMEAGGGNIQVFDQNGMRHARVATSFGNARYAAESELGRYVCMKNHLVLIVLLDRFLILDFLSDPAAPRLLTMREFSQQEGNLFTARNTLVGIPRAGTRNMQLELQSGRMSSNVGPLTESLVCFGTEEGIMAINPITGAELWERRDIPSGVEILGDENYVILKPVDGTSATILRARDGGFVKNVELPPGVMNCLDRQYGDWGKFLPEVTQTESRFSFRLYDPVREMAAWSFEGPAGTRWAPVSGQKLAFLQPNRKLTVREGLTGKEIFQTTLAYDGAADQFFLLEFADQWIVCLDTRLSQAHHPEMTTKRTAELVRTDVDGPVIALNRHTGKVLWSRPIPNQQVLTQGPNAWPVLVFCKFRGSMESLVLNRLTGEIIRKEPAALDELGAISWLTEEQPSRLHLTFGQDRITLLFGSNDSSSPTREKPGTAPAPAQEER